MTGNFIQDEAGKDFGFISLLGQDFTEIKGILDGRQHPDIVQGHAGKALVFPASSPEDVSATQDDGDAVTQLFYCDNLISELVTDLVIIAKSAFTSEDFSTQLEHQALDLLWLIQAILPVLWAYSPKA